MSLALSGWMDVAVQPEIKPENLPPEEPALCRLELQGVPLVASFPTSVQEHAFLQRLAPQSKILKACFRFRRRAATPCSLAGRGAL